MTGRDQANPGGPASPDLVLGIDGGGTKTVAWLAPRDQPEEQAVLGRGTAAGSNIRVSGIEAATSSLNRAIDGAFADAGVERGRVSSASLGLAGCEREAERAMLAQWARATGLAERVRITNDALPILYAATADGCGIALIAGTGSLALGRDSRGTVARSGGWGPSFGDEGSGYRIALAGLRAAAHFVDGRGPETALLEAYLSRLDLREASELITAIYSPQMDRAGIAETSEVVFAAAENGDSVAANLVKAASGELAAMVLAVARRLKLAEVPVPLALSGGVLLAQAMLREQLLAALADAGLAVAPVTCVAQPVAGALRMAATS